MIFQGDVGFLIMEEDLKGRFELVERYCEDHIITLGMRNIFFKNSLIRTTFIRIQEIEIIKKKYAQVSKNFSGLKVLFISNSEGYISRNICSWIKKQNPSLKIVALQHGIFILNKSKAKKTVILLLNELTKKCLNFEFFGTGFASDHVDAYVVYNKAIRQEILDYGVGKRKVYISSSILKGELYYKTVNKIKKGGLLVLQPLSALGITSPENEKMLLQRVIQWISNEQEEVLIKQHPYANIELGKLPPNCTITDDSINDLKDKVSIAYSFYSTALKELDYFGVRCIAIFSKHLMINRIIYEHFNEVISFDRSATPEIVKKLEKSQSFFESTINMEELVSDVLN